MVDMVTRKYNKYPEINKYSDMIRGQGYGYGV